MRDGETDVAVRPGDRLSLSQMEADSNFFLSAKILLVVDKHSEFQVEGLCEPESAEHPHEEPEESAQLFWREET